MAYFKHVGMDRDAICRELLDLKMWEVDLRERLKVLDELDEARREKPAELRQSLTDLIKRRPGGRPPLNGDTAQTPEERRASNTEAQRRSRARKADAA
jgi:hypothetical protein|nr:hypothetical protein [uncultured Brevundimonas sp.]